MMNEAPATTSNRRMASALPMAAFVLPLVALCALSVMPSLSSEVRSDRQRTMELRLALTELQRRAAEQQEARAEDESDCPAPAPATQVLATAVHPAAMPSAEMRVTRRPLPEVFIPEPMWHCAASQGRAPPEERT